MWEQLAGMDHEKSIIERRVIMPLARPEEARRHGVEPPRAIVLFGPSGTGRTTFAKGIASRLRWLFVELFPRRLEAEGQERQAALREFFARATQMDERMLFIDEVEEIASVRGGRPVTTR